MVKQYLPVDQMKDSMASQKAVAIVVESATAIKPEKKTTAKKKSTKKADDEVEAEVEEVSAEQDAE